MGEVSSGVSQQAFDGLAATVAAAIPLGTYTVATLPAADATNLYRLAGVTDLFGNRATRVRCERITVAGTDYFYWQPQSSDSYGDLNIAASDTTIGALTMPTQLRLTGNVLAGVARKITLSDGAFPGQTKEISSGGLIGVLGSLSILGTGLGAGIALLAGGYTKYWSDWISTPGTKTWVKAI